MQFKIGMGYDIHKLIIGRPLKLGGIEIPFTKGPKAHSDGDVLLHALIDALLGATGKGDIGQHFPDTDAKWKDAKSTDMLVQVFKPIYEREWAVNNLDATILTEQPKLKKYIPAMREHLANILQMEKMDVNIKAGTNEECGEIGRGEAIAAQVVVLLELRPRSKHPFSIT
ncbi:MAG: 2-C-methyl-D-erythritol 2,4-cyclodiphosphate synthase [Deltaproteobacteria bacterium RIFCSPLOWO2_02_FULL_44_10]|nr:MAG: 2-C-methyl-D-erythritol 2,4-cyclodiphosphate synthase [Deltaproteobacteria bacterium RIFCSPHIGHO2_02_FULL_44_16]OGQ45501.1 MAG: 2-C-methyl-D-erythritol 2,4-cyclodiphosphate synthase [Deltaproteobacteria bacterium RIFCSPLOWO2_02_FULL_44_10]